MKIPPKTIVIGAESFLGRGFYTAYRPFYPDLLGTDYRSSDPRKKLDLISPELEPLKIKKGEYTHAIITASKTNLVLCEEQKALTYRYNVEGILKLVKALIEYEIQPILFSTAYVFDGIAGDYTEDAKTNPINEYGLQKELLEKLIPKLCGDNYLMIRCSKVFDLVKGTGTLLDQICSQLTQKQCVRAAQDQVFCPILFEDLVNAVISLQINQCKGLYNLCGQEIWTRYDIARELASSFGVPTDLVVPISLDEVQNVYRMPRRTNMNCTKFHQSVSFNMTPLSCCIDKIKNSYLNEATYGTASLLREAIMG